MIKETLSVCPHCYKKIKADVKNINNNIVLQKVCLEHGLIEGIIEVNPDFYRMCCNLKSNFRYDELFLEITDKCNMAKYCKYCYYNLNQSKDKTINNLINNIPNYINTIILTGGEPTVREDLFQIIEKLKKKDYKVNLITNGIRLSSPQYLSQLFETGIDKIHFSLHPRENNNNKIYKLKKEVLKNVRNLDYQLESLMFTIDKLRQVEEILDTSNKYKDIVRCLRIRIAFNAWKENKTSNIYLSELYQKIRDKSIRENKRFFINKRLDNNIYHLNVAYGSFFVRLIKLPNKYNTDLKELECAPYVRGKNGKIGNIAYMYGVINEKLDKKDNKK